MEHKVQDEIIDAIINIMQDNNMQPEEGITETLNAVTRFLSACAAGLGIKKENEKIAFIKGIYQQIVDQL